MHGGVLPGHLTIAVLARVPVHAGGCVETRASLLHDDASDDVLERSCQGLQVFEAVGDDVVRPLVHLLGIVGAVVQRVVDSLTHNCLHIFSRKLRRIILKRFSHDNWLF